MVLKHWYSIKKVFSKKFKAFNDLMKQIFLLKKLIFVIKFEKFFINDGIFLSFDNNQPRKNWFIIHKKGNLSIKNIHQ